MAVHYHDHMFHSCIMQPPAVDRPVAIPINNALQCDWGTIQRDNAYSVFIRNDPINLRMEALFIQIFINTSSYLTLFLRTIMLMVFSTLSQIIFTTNLFKKVSGQNNNLVKYMIHFGFLVKSYQPTD